MSGRTLAADGGSIDLSGANVSYVVVVAAIALVALGFAVALRKSVLAAPQGTEKMQEIAAAVQEGASAFLTRQFRTLAWFAVLALVLLILLPADTVGDPDRPLPLLPRRRAVLLLHRLRGHVSRHPRQRARRRCRPRARRRGERRQDRLPHRRRRRHLDRRSRPARCAVGRPHLPGRRAHRARGLRLRRRAARDVHAGRRRHLHQGRRRRRRPRRQGRAGHPRGRPAQRRDDRRQRRRQRR